MVFEIKNLPQLSEFCTITMLDNLEALDAYKAVKILIAQGKYSSKPASQFMLALIVRSLPHALMLSAFTDFCLVRLDNQFFRVH